MNVESRVSRYLERLERMEESLKGEDSSNVEVYRNFLNYVLQNPEHTYYPITKLLTAAKCKDAIEALDVAKFFSLGVHPLLVVTFCYFDFDGTDIKIDRESFIESLLKGTPPIEYESGCPINDFDPSRLGFFCNLVSE